MFKVDDPHISKVHTERFAIANPALNQEYVMLYDLQKDYRRIKSYVHKCPECGKRMHRYTDADRLKCPICKDEWMEETDWFLWD